MSKKKGTNFLAQGTILAAAAMITKVVGLAYRIPLTNIRRRFPGVQPCVDAHLLQPSYGRVQAGVRQSGRGTV